MRQGAKPNPGMQNNALRIWESISIHFCRGESGSLQEGSHMAGAALQRRRKSIPPQAPTLSPYSVIRILSGVLSHCQRSKALRILLRDGAFPTKSDDEPCGWMSTNASSAENIRSLCYLTAREDGRDIHPRPTPFALRIVVSRLQSLGGMFWCGLASPSSAQLSSLRGLEVT